MSGREEEDRKARMFGKKLRTLRKEHHLTQAELAQSLRLTSRTLINYELGKCFPKQLEILSRIATLFDVTVDYLMMDTDTEDNPLESDGEYTEKPDSDAKILLEQIKEAFHSGNLSENDRDSVFRTVCELYWKAKADGRKPAENAKSESQNNTVL